MTRGALFFLPILGLLLAAGVAPLAQADFVFLNDGFTLRGKVQKEGEILRDPGGQELWMPKFGGFYVVDDKVRRVIFSHRNVSQAVPDPADQARALEVFTPRQALYQYPTSPTLNSFRVDDATPWQPSGERKLTLTTGTATRPIEQAITLISPHFVIAGGRKLRWNASYLTSELDPEAVLAVIRHHLLKRNEDAQQKKGNANTEPVVLSREQRRSIIRFCIQAGWLAQAEAELRALDKDFPEEKDKGENLAKELRRLQANHLMDMIERARRAGQHDRVQKLLATFAESGAPEGAVNQVHRLRAQYQALNVNLQAARTYLTRVQKEVQDPTLRQAIAEPLAEMERGLNLDTAGRLEAFVTLARQEERNRAQGRAPDLEPGQLMALAVSGWVLDNNGAEAQVDQALRLWRTRLLVVRYLQTPDSAARSQMLDQYSRSESLRVDTISQLIEMLPPVAPEAVSGDGRLELSTRPEKGPKGIRYLVQVPPEYHMHRPYPVLVVLHNVGEEPGKMLARWRAAAADHGYLLVAPEWTDLLSTYQASEREHSAVVEVVQDLRRRFHVNSERIILAGFDQSATMACDLAMARPGLFAGVVAMCGRPGRFAGNYWPNAQYLPFYVVDGEKNNEGPKEPRGLDNRTLMERWLPKGYPSLYIEYTGRGLEFFSGELPSIFDWLGRRKRGKGLPELGRPDPQGGSLGQEFRSVRASDSRFYWITSDNIATGNFVAKLTARIAHSNQIIVNTSQFRNVTVWLNSSMVDFEQPVEVRWNAASPSGRVFKRQLEPNLKVLLEDYYERGDKKNLFVAKVTFP